MAADFYVLIISMLLHLSAMFGILFRVSQLNIHVVIQTDRHGRCQDLSKADKEKIAQAIEKLEALETLMKILGK